MDTRKLREKFLDEVKQAVCKDRTQTHGPPEDNFRDIAWHWTGWLRTRYKIQFELDAIDVGWMSVLQKAARAAGNPTYHDNPLDGAGYAACVGGILKAREAASEAIPERAEERPAAFDPSDGPGGTVYMAYKTPDPEPGFVPTHYRNLDGAPVRVLDRGEGFVVYRTESGKTWSVLPSSFAGAFTLKELWVDHKNPAPIP